MTEIDVLDIINKYIHTTDVSSIILDYIQEIRFIYSDKSGDHKYVRSIQSNILNIKQTNYRINYAILHLVQIESAGIVIINKPDTFYNCKFLTRIPKYIKIKTSNLSGTFEGCKLFNQDISHWDVSKVTNMNNMFASTTFNKPLNNWDVGNVKHMYRMFYRSMYNHKLKNWNVSNVITMDAMFKGSQFKKNITGWDIKKVKSLTDIFTNSRMAKSRWINEITLNWDLSHISRVSMFGSRHNTGRSTIRWHLVGQAPYLAGQSSANLKIICREFGISGYSKKKKYELIKMILIKCNEFLS